MAMVLLLLVLGTLILTGLNQQLTTFSALVGGESRSLQQQARCSPRLSGDGFRAGRQSHRFSARRLLRGERVCAS